MDGLVLGFSMVATVATGLVFGLVSVFHGTDVNLIDSLKVGAGRSEE